VRIYILYNIGFYWIIKYVQIIYFWLIFAFWSTLKFKKIKKNVFYLQVETAYTTVLATLLIVWGYRNLRLSSPPHYTSLVPAHQSYPSHLMLGRKMLLLLYCLIWAVEIGFKFASQTVVYLLNPCHIVTVMQVR
jgi:hypothetical protein